MDPRNKSGGDKTGQAQVPSVLDIARSLSRTHRDATGSLGKSTSGVLHPRGQLVRKLPANRNWDNQNSR